jgi:hypothetical protein
MVISLKKVTRLADAIKYTASRSRYPNVKRVRLHGAIEEFNLEVAINNRLRLAVRLHS